MRRAGALVFAVFITAGRLKGTAFLQPVPVDLTGLAAVLTVAICGVLLLSSGRILRVVGWAVALFAAFAVALPWSSLHGYSLDKTGRLFTFTLIAAVAPFVLLRTRQARVWFLVTLSAVGLMLAFDAVVLHSAGGTGLRGRLATEDGNTISLGRAAGLTFVAGAIMLLRTSRHRLFYGAGVTLTALALVGAGSRGPLLAAVVAVGFLMLKPRQGRTRIVRRVAPLVMFGLVGWLALLQAPDTSTARYTQGSSTRLGLYSEAWSDIRTSPLGVGWGDYQGAVLDEDARPYPHNILLEITAEAGWLAGIVFAVYLWTAVARRARTRGDLVGEVELAVLIFLLVNALFSGDVNDNRALFVFMALGVMSHANRTAAHGTESPVVRPGTAGFGREPDTVSWR